MHSEHTQIAQNSTAGLSYVAYHLRHIKEKNVHLHEVLACGGHRLESMQYDGHHMKNVPTSSKYAVILKIWIYMHVEGAPRCVEQL